MSKAVLYRPLLDNEIRVLRIAPLKKGQDDSAPIRCQLRHVLLSTKQTAERPSDAQWPEAHVPYDCSCLFKKGRELPSKSSKSTGVVEQDRDSVPPARYSWGDYVALSYLWGPQTPFHHISVDGVQVAVGPNLYAALQRLRKSRLVVQGLQIWVDALCINQDDIAERGQQVGRMRDIYAGALQVVIWLGGDANGHRAKLAFTAVEWLAQRKLLDDPLGGFYRESRKIDARPLFMLWAKYDSPFRDEVYQSLYHLFTNPYWQRMWIIQEVVLGSFDSPVLYGDSCLTWLTLCQAAEFVKLDEQRFGRQIMASMRPRILGSWTYEVARDRVVGERPWSADRTWTLMIQMAALQLYQKSASSALASNPARLLRPLSMAREANVTDDKDRVYGILGMKAIADLIYVIPNYSREVAEIYIEFSERLLARDVNLLRLCTVGHMSMYPASAKPKGKVLGPLLYGMQDHNQRVTVDEQCTHALPSWAVCWICKPCPVARLTGLFSAGGRMVRAEGKCSRSEKCLTLRGRIIDNIVSLSTVHGHSATLEATELKRPPENAYGTLSELRNAFCRTITLEATGSFNPADQLYAALLDPRLWYDSVAGVYTNGFGLEKFYKDNKDAIFCGQRLRTIISGARQDRWWKRQTRVYNPTEVQLESLTKATNTLAWRRLMGTENGRIGLAPACTKVGDQVAVFAGCDTPIIIRRRGDAFEIVGEAYLHGVMYGEVLEAVDFAWDKLDLV